jgi:sugar phosphate isomerase/epimerase
MSQLPRPELALGVLPYLDTPAPAFVEAAAAAGFDAVSLRVSGSRTPVAADLAVHPALLDETAAALDATGVRVLDVEVLRLYAGDRALERRAEEAVLLGRRFGARHLITINQDLPVDACARALRRVCDVASAEPGSPQVCLEFMAFSATTDLSAAADVVRRAEHPLAAVLLDTLHFSRTGGRPAEVGDHLDVLAPYVQVCGVPRRPSARGLMHEATRSRRLPGRGTGDDLAVLSVVPDEWAISVEAPVRRDRRRSAARRAQASFDALTAALATVAREVPAEASG